jgi:hypothetical protein
MNYAEIVDVALGYADRTDAEVTNRMDSFLRIVEARTNRPLSTQKMVSRVTIDSITDQEYYGLPADFDGLRDIEVRSTVAGTITPKYHSPEQMNNRIGRNCRDIAYAIIDDQLQLQPAQTDAVIELVYYQNLEELSTGTPNNWLSDLYPDCYIFGLLVEINAFVKDAETASMWDARFKESVAEIKSNDQDTRWSGTSMQMRTE